MSSRELIGDQIDSTRDWWTGFDFDDFLLQLQQSGFKGKRERPPKHAGQLADDTETHTRSSVSPVRPGC